MSRAVPGVALALLLVSCGGGGGGGSSSGGGAVQPLPPAAPLSSGSPNVDSSDNATDWTSLRYDPSGSGDNALQSSITEKNVASLSPAWIFHGTVGSYSSVAIANGVVYRTELGGNAYAINEASGAQMWNYAPPAAESFVPSPLVAGGLLYLASTTGDFYAVGAKSGLAQFAYTPQSAWGPLINGTEERGHYRGSPVYEHGLIYTGASNHEEPQNCIQGAQVLALDPLSATTKASLTLTQNQTSGVGVWTTPVFDASGDMFVATGNSCGFTNAPYGDSMLRLDRVSLNILWHTPGPVDANDWDFGATPVVVNNEVIDGGKDGYVYAFDTASGHLLWKQSPFPSGAILGAVASDGTHVVVPFAVSADKQHGGVAVFDLNGNLQWSLVTGIDSTYPSKGVISPPAISQGMVFFGYEKSNCSANCDGLGAFDLATGKQLWWYSTPTPIFGGIVVVNGGVFASEIGNPTLYCFQPASKGTNARRPSMTYGTHRAPPAYYHDPWLKSSQVEGNNVGPLY